ncbi:MAG: hypothetical protein RL119_516, partial [Actinomycetota bacterium]
HQVLWPRLQADDKLRFIYDLEIQSSEALYRIERNGVLIDAPTLAAQSHALGQRIVQLETEAYEIAGQPFNLASPKQLGEIFFDKLGLPVIKKTATGARSTDEEVLEKLAEDYPLPAKILEHRSLSKLKGCLIIPWIDVSVSCFDWIAVHNDWKVRNDPQTIQGTTIGNVVHWSLPKG